MSEEWKENAKNYFRQCYDYNFDSEYEFEKGKSFCQVIGAALYGDQADCEAVDGDETKFGYSKEKADHIFKIQNVIYLFNLT